MKCVWPMRMLASEGNCNGTLWNSNIGPRDLLHVEFHVVLAVDRNLHRFSRTEERLQNFRPGPLQVPPIFQSQHGVFPGRDGRQGEGAIAVALITPIEERTI